jgi:ribosomal protein S18 acetylase RimI-like enzyme
MAQTENNDLSFLKIADESAFPDWARRDVVARFFHETMKPYHDSLEDVQSALDYGLVPGKGAGGFLMLVHEDEELLGACLMLRTGMSGYVPEYILLFVSVAPEARGRGVGSRLIMRCIEESGTDVKLHVEYDNPAKRLYERLGFTSDYAEMRYKQKAD